MFLNPGMEYTLWRDTPWRVPTESDSILLVNMKDLASRSEFYRKEPACFSKREAPKKRLYITKNIELRIYRGCLFILIYELCRLTGYQHKQH